MKVALTSTRLTVGVGLSSCEISVSENGRGAAVERGQHLSVRRQRQAERLRRLNVDLDTGRRHQTAVRQHRGFDAVDDGVRGRGPIAGGRGETQEIRAARQRRVSLSIQPPDPEAKIPSATVPNIEPIKALYRKYSRMLVSPDAPAASTSTSLKVGNDDRSESRIS